jgi:hypothetical protein
MACELQIIMRLPTFNTLNSILMTPLAQPSLQSPLSISPSLHIASSLASQLLLLLFGIPITTGEIKFTAPPWNQVKSEIHSSSLESGEIHSSSLESGEIGLSAAAALAAAFLFIFRSCTYPLMFPRIHLVLGLQYIKVDIERYIRL